MVHDLFKLEEKIDYSKAQPDDKKYYLIPLRLTEDCYQVDDDMLDFVQEVSEIGYKEARENSFVWGQYKGRQDLTPEEKQEEIMSKILVRE